MHRLRAAMTLLLVMVLMAACDLAPAQPSAPDDGTSDETPVEGTPIEDESPPAGEAPVESESPVDLATEAPAGGELTSTFEWSSTGPLLSPQGSDHASVKDPTVVLADGEWHVFFTTALTSGGWQMAYTSFTDWSEAGSTEYFRLENSGIGTGYRAAPEVFYFEPEGLWYLVYQTGNASYSTNPDINDPSGWSAPRHFYDGMPQTIADNIGNGNWVDMWVICDDASCYLFSSDDNGHLYRSETSVDQFPEGFDEPVIALEDSPNALFEAANVYRVAGSDQYLLIHEAIGSNGRRWFRSWTSTDIGGSWTSLADTESNPFASAANVTFEDGPAWTEDISHGEVARTSVDQTLTIDPCNLQYLYQGVDPSAGGDYNQLPYRLGLLTQTNSAC
jgi:hypothetical protein